MWYYWNPGATQKYVPAAQSEVATHLLRNVDLEEPNYSPTECIGHIFSYD